MDNLYGGEIKDWVGASGKAFEFIKALGHAVSNLGGNCDDLDRVLKEPKVCEEIALLIMGALSTVPISPMEIIRTTGRSEDVKEDAARLLNNDADRLETISLANCWEVASAALEGIEDKRGLAVWYSQISKDTKIHWSFSEEHRNIHESILETMDDTDLLEIVLQKDSFYEDAIKGMEDQEILKTAYASLDESYPKKVAISRIEDIQFIRDALTKELAYKFPDTEYVDFLRKAISYAEGNRNLDD